MIARSVTLKILCIESGQLLHIRRVGRGPITKLLDFGGIPDFFSGYWNILDSLPLGNRA